MTHTPRWLAAIAIALAGGASVASSPSTAPAVAPTTVPAVDYVKLASALGDRDPAVRKGAFDQLALAAEAARPALSRAIHSGRPAVVAAATDLLLRTRWYMPDDPPGVQQRIGQYGQRPPRVRTGVLNKLAAWNDPAFHKAALRVSQQEPVDGVVWNAFATLALDDSWDHALETAAGAVPSPVLIARARGLILAHCPDYRDRADAPQADRITQMLERALDQERDHPTADAWQLSWAVKRLVSHYLAADQPARAAEKLRILVGRGDATPPEIDPNAVNAIPVPLVDPDDEDAGAQPPLTPVQRLLELQAAAGPLPGFDADLTAAGDENADRAALAIGAIAMRTGSPVAGHLLISRALADQPNESDNDRAERLFAAGLMLFKAGVGTEAQTAMERIVAMELPGIDRITDAYLRLSDIYALQRDYQLAGDSLQRAFDHLGPGGGLQVRRGNGKREPWPREDVQGKIAYYYLLAAKAHGDNAEMRKQALAVMSSGSTDSGIFLDTLPTLEDPGVNATDKETIDAYFDRVYAKAVDRLAQASDDPMEMNDMAWLCARSGRHLDQALDLGSKAVAAKPAESAYLDTLAEATFRTGKPAEALALELKAVQLLPDNAFMHEQVERFKKAAATQPAK